MDPKQLHHAGFNFTPTLHADTYDFISPTHQNLNGKRVFISGASKGIGKETALSFAKAGASAIALGARSSLTALALDVVSAAKEAGHPEPKVISIVLDVTDVKSTEAAATKVKEEFGGLDILFNNAGYLEVFKKFADADPEEWWRTQEVNTKGAFLVARAFIPVLLATEGGLKTILNTSSIGAHIKMPGGSSYMTSKSALLRLGEFIQMEYEDEGILVYAIHPGAVMTELASNMPDESHHILTDTPALAADTVVWLTGQKKEWLACRYVSVTWDMEQLLGKREEIVKKDLLKVRMAVD